MFETYWSKCRCRVQQFFVLLLAQNVICFICEWCLAWFMPHLKHWVWTTWHLNRWKFTSQGPWPTGSTLVSSSTTRWVWPTPCGTTRLPRRPTFGCRPRRPCTWHRRSLEASRPRPAMPGTFRRRGLFEGRARGDFLCEHWGGGWLLGADLVGTAVENHQGKKWETEQLCRVVSVNPVLIDH